MILLLIDPKFEGDGSYLDKCVSGLELLKR